jgi:hypothetical protein
VSGYSSSGAGVYGETSVGSSTSTFGVYGQNNGTGIGVMGKSTNGIGLAGASSTNHGVYGQSNLGYAGYFDGKVKVNGDFQATGAKAFQIDHPLDPQNKYLNHSCVESPDMKNGEAWVELPEWFEALNRDFRYQLTALGQPGPNLYIAEEIQNNRFKIAGGKPGMKVSWQVTGIRQDPWAEAHRIPVEEVKPPQEQGTYLHPELYGQPEEKSVNWKHLQGIRQLQPLAGSASPEKP